MMDRRYWGLFWIAMAMAAHSVIVGRFLGSSFFMLLFFWGWVAAAAYRGKLESARAMAITMLVILVGVTVALAFRSSAFENELAFYAFALYPAVVSWFCVYFYVRHLMRRQDEGTHTSAAQGGRKLWSVLRHGGIGWPTKTRA
jgi:Ca2+/Na+ antiporter